MIKLALIGSLLGLVLLFFLVNQVEIKEINIIDAYKKQVNEWVKVKGKIKWIREYDWFTLINLCSINLNNSCIFILIYSTQLRLKPNQTIEVLGKIKLYKGRKEIQAERIKLI